MYSAIDIMSSATSSRVENISMNDMPTLVIVTSLQIRAGRAMAGLTQAQLAREAGLSTTGLNNIESGRADAKGSTLRRLQQALEAHGVEFTNDTHPGVRMRAR
jgi:DNA-binding XRE family transcriptional regulator